MLSSMDCWKERMLILFGVFMSSMLYVVFRSYDNIVGIYLVGFSCRKIMTSLSTLLIGYDIAQCL